MLLSADKRGSSQFVREDGDLSFLGFIILDAAVKMFFAHISGTWNVILEVKRPENKRWSSVCMPRLGVERVIQPLHFLSTATQTKDGEQDVWTRGRATWNYQDCIRGETELLCAININVVKTETIYQRFHNRPAKVKSK